MTTPGQFHHLMLEVTDLERAERFYCAALGFEPMGRGLWGEDRPHATLRVQDGQCLVLIQVPTLEPDGPGAHTQVYLSAERWHETLERLQRLGHRLHDDRKAGLVATGELMFHAADPDGHIVEMSAHEPAASEFPPAGRGKIKAGRIGDFAVGSVTHVREGKFFLVREDGGFLALSETCSHMPFPVVYQPEHYRFYCACHRYRFTRTGKYVRRIGANSADPLFAYAVELVDGQVVVDTDHHLARTEEEADVLVPLP